MVRHLLVMRHAKSSWKSDAPSDHARPLNKRGRAAAPLMAAKLRELGLCPAAVFASDAQRARETWARCATELPPPAHLIFTSQLYFARFAGVLDELATAPDDLGVLLAIGHNPGWERLVGWLCDEQVIMKTANIAVLEAALPRWRDGLQAPGSWSLSRVLRPR
jgi:phosphohistidine phosphatase